MVQENQKIWVTSPNLVSFSSAYVPPPIYPQANLLPYDLCLSLTTPNECSEWSQFSLIFFFSLPLCKASLASAVSFRFWWTRLILVRATYAVLVTSSVKKLLQFNNGLEIPPLPHLELGKTMIVRALFQPPCAHSPTRYWGNILCNARFILLTSIRALINCLIDNVEVSIILLLSSWRTKLFSTLISRGNADPQRVQVSSKLFWMYLFTHAEIKPNYWLKG